MLDFRVKIDHPYDHIGLFTPVVSFAKRVVVNLWTHSTREERETRLWSGRKPISSLINVSIPAEQTVSVLSLLSHACSLGQTVHGGTKSLNICYLETVGGKGLLAATQIKCQANFDLEVFISGELT